VIAPNPIDISFYSSWSYLEAVGPAPGFPPKMRTNEPLPKTDPVEVTAWMQRAAVAASAELERKIAKLRTERNLAIRIAGADFVISGPATNGSADRLNVMLRCLNRAAPEVFWPVFLKAWPSCDGTWAQKERLLARLRRQGSGVDHLPEQTREWLGTLPQSITIYRGCSRSRSRGLSWTTDRDVALSFALGHRGLQVPNAVIVTALVSKANVFAAFLDREENEVLVEPSSLEIIGYELIGSRRASKLSA
jgi:hypothetical protein